MGDNKIKTILEGTSSLQSLSKPLFDSLNLSYFCCVEADKNATFSAVSTNADWMQLFYDRKYYNVGVDAIYPFHLQANHSEKKFIVWDQVSKAVAHNVIIEELCGHQIFNLCTLIETSDDRCSIYHFGNQDASVNLNQFYYEQRHLLELFISYFKDNRYNRKELIQSFDSKIKFDEAIAKASTPDPNNVMVNVAELKKQLAFERYYITRDIYLTKRELQCFKWIYLGKTAEETAVILNISKRTTEMHLDNIRQKLNCSKITQLFQILQQHLPVIVML